MTVPASADVVISIPLTGADRQILLDLCDHGTWANRMRFDGLCQGLKNQFDEAVAKANAKAAEEKAAADAKAKEKTDPEAPPAGPQ